MSFNNPVTIEAQFDEIQNIQRPDLKVDDSSSMGAGVILALDMLGRRKQEYRKYGIDHYQPTMLLVTNDKVTDDITAIAKRSAGEVENKKLDIRLFTFGNGVDKAQLLSFTPNQTILKFSLNFKFKELF